MLFFLTNRLGSKRLFPIITAIKTFILYALICFPFVDGAIAEAINTTNYFPLESGKQWTYLENGLNTVTITVLPGYEYVNGVQTKIVQSTGGESSGVKLNYTNDSNGIRNHKEFDPDVFVDGVGFVDVTVIYDPPLRHTYQTANIGELIYSSGNLEVTFSGIGTFDLHYDQTTKIVGFENINVPLRNFKAIKIQESFTMSGYIGDEYVSETMTSTNWLAEYIGVTKEIDVSGSDTDTIELTGINFSPPISADFSAATTDGLTPLTVSFNDKSIGYINNWSWDFGDGSTSTDQHPSHTYINPDIYTVSLTVAGLGGSDTETKTDYVIVKKHVSMPWIPLLLLDE